MYILICVYMHIYKYFYRGSPVITFAFSVLIHIMKKIRIATPIPTLSLCVCVCVCVYVQLCPTLCDPRYCSPPGSSVHGISQARILE